MIQLVAQKTETTDWNLTVPMRLNLADKIVGTPIFGTTTIGSDIYYHLEFPHFLYKLESQLTGKTKIFTRPVYFNVGKNVNAYERWIWLSFNHSTNPAATEDLSLGRVVVGTDEFPLGFYNITIYETDTLTELDPANATATLYYGLLNMTPSTATTGTGNFEEVQYTEYSNNDTENESVYLTN